jgi:hypothetical protein
VIVTAVPIGPEVCDRLVIVGDPCKVYVALATRLFVSPVAVAITLTVSFVVTVNGALYVIVVPELGVGKLPSVV